MGSRIYFIHGDCVVPMILKAAILFNGDQPENTNNTRSYPTNQLTLLSKISNGIHHILSLFELPKTKNWMQNRHKQTNKQTKKTWEYSSPLLNNLNSNRPVAQPHARARWKTCYITINNRLVKTNGDLEGTSCGSNACHQSKLNFLM